MAADSRGVRHPEFRAISPDAFQPFPPALVARIAAVPQPAGYGLELLPFLRWLCWHLQPSRAVLLDDLAGLSGEALPAAMPGVLRAATPDAIPEGADLVHAPGETADAAIHAIVGRLAPGGVLVTGPAGRDGGVRLPIGDGMTLFAGAPAPPALAWLAAQDGDAFAAAMNELGIRIAATATLEIRAASGRTDWRAEQSAKQQVHHAVARVEAERDAARLERDRAVAEREAVITSTSWRLTGPLRRALLAAKNRRSSAPPPPEPVSERDAVRADAAEKLRTFLQSGERIVLPQAAQPDVSVLLVLFNQAPFTHWCLRSIADTLPPDASVEVVIVDNASADHTGALLARVDGATVIRNTDNKHFLHGVNQAAAAARGRDILLLNNDARLRPGAIQAAHATLHSAPDIGAVGGKIILPGGPLQEAGSIIWNDGTCVGYGRTHSPTYPAYQFRRDVDFCSGAFLLVRGALWRQLGGLDPAFAPAYYEEVDLCMRVHEAGYRIVYEPAVAIDHFEFGSATNPEQAFALQRRNHALFTERHAARLAEHHVPPGTNLVVARADRGRRRLLYIDDRVPYPQLGAGYPRAARLLKELVADGWFITVYPAHDPEDDWDDTYAAFPREIEFMLGHGHAELPGFLHDRDGAYDTVMVSRPHNMTAFLKARGATHSRARLIYDAEAMFAAREVLRAEQAGRPLGAETRQALVDAEMALTLPAATVTSVNEQEAAVFRAAGHRDVRVLGLGVEPAPVPAGFAARSGFLFVGTVDEDLSPNVDALSYFVGAVMPELAVRLGTAPELWIAGRCRSPRVQALAGPHVHLLGLVPDLTPLYATARVFVAPHRYAAGMPLKVQEAAARGLPVVASPLLAGQLGWSDGTELLVGSDAAGLAEACARLHGDPALWRHIRRNALARLTAECKADEFGATLRAIMRG